MSAASVVCLHVDISEGELITRPKESYRLWLCRVCDLETSRMRSPWPTGGCRGENKQTNKQTRSSSPSKFRCLLEV